LAQASDTTSSSDEGEMWLEFEQSLNRITSVSKIEEQGFHSPAVVSVISAATIRERGYRSLYDLLLQTPGFWAIQDINDKLLGVRGVHASTSQKFLLLLNGRRVTENLWNLTDVDYNVSLANVKRVEIVRGPGSAIYGRSALTAVINVITDDAIDGFKLDASMGTFGYRRAGLSFAKQFEDGAKVELWAHAVSIDGQRVDVPADDDGSAARVDGAMMVDRFVFPTGGMGARIDVKGWRIDLLAQARTYQQPRAQNSGTYWQDLEASNYFNQTNYRERGLGEEKNYLVANLERELRAGATRHTVGVGYTFSRLRFKEVLRPQRDVAAIATWSPAEQDAFALGEMFEVDAESHRVGADYFGLWEISAGKLALWGAEITQTRPGSSKFSSNYASNVVSGRIVNTPIPGGYFREKVDGIFGTTQRTERLYSAYAEARWQWWERLFVSAGARYDVHEKGEDFRDDQQSVTYPDPLADQKRAAIPLLTQQLSPRIAVTYKPLAEIDGVVKATYNRSFVAPGYFYRYADPSTSYAGGPWLKPETLDNFTLAAEGSYAFTRFKALYFVNINQDLLTRDTTLSPARYESAGTLAMHGAELEVQYDLGSTLTGFANYSLLKGVRRWTDDVTEPKWIMWDDSLKNFPTSFGNLGVTGRFLNRELSATVSLLWHGPIRTLIGSGVGAGTAQTIDPGAIIDLVVSWKPEYVALLKGTEWSAAVRNVLDARVVRGGTVTRPYQQAGRWMSVSVAKTF
jgi:outer membrane receptor protein involved in Fe transport